MSYLLIKKGGQKPSSGSLPSNRNNDGQNPRRNPAISSSSSAAHPRRPGVSGGGGNHQWRNPSSCQGGGGNSFPRPPSFPRGGIPTSNQHHSNDGGELNQRQLNNAVVVNDGEGGQVQLQRMVAPSLQRQQQAGPVQQNQNQQAFQGLVSMDEGERYDYPLTLDRGGVKHWVPK